jgi:hypothetical protein
MQLTSRRGNQRLELFYETTPSDWRTKSQYVASLEQHGFSRPADLRVRLGVNPSPIKRPVRCLHLRAWPRSTPISALSSATHPQHPRQLDRWVSRPRHDIIHADAGMNDTDRGSTDTSDAGKVELRPFETSNYADGLNWLSSSYRRRVVEASGSTSCTCKTVVRPSSTAGFT